VCGYSPQRAGAVPHSLPPGGPRGPRMALLGALQGRAPHHLQGGSAGARRSPYLSSARQRARRSPFLMALHHAGLRVTTALQ